MKVFRISSSGWEIYGQHSLTHESKTKEEFEQDCREVLTEVFRETIDTMEIDTSKAFMGANDLMDMGVPKLLERGYKPLEFEGDYEVPGDDGSFMSCSQSQTEAIKEFGAEVVEEFVHKAKMIDNRM